MQNFKDLTNFLSHLKILGIPSTPSYPRLALLASSKVSPASLRQSLFALPLIPPNLSHKLACLEIRLQSAPERPNGAEYTFRILNTNEEFICLEDFHTRLNNYIDTSSNQDYSETLMVEISSPLLPYLTILELPRLHESLVESEKDSQLIQQESLRKKAIKKILRDQRNTILTVLSREDNLNTSKPFEYLRRFDPYNIRSILAFSVSLLLTESLEIKTQRIRNLLQGRGFPAEYDFVVLREHDSNRKGQQELDRQGLSEEVTTSSTIDSQLEAMTKKDNESRNRERLWNKLREITQFSTRSVIPGLLDTLRLMNEIESARLSFLEQELKKEGFDSELKPLDFALIIVKKISQEFQERLGTRDTTTNREKRANSITVAQELRASLQMRPRSTTETSKTQTSDEALKIGESKGMSEGNEPIKALDAPQKSACRKRIESLFENLFEDDFSKSHLALFNIVSRDEAAEITRTADSQTVKGIVESQGFHTAVTTRLQWLTNATYETLTNTYDAISSMVLELLDKYLKLLPGLKKDLKDEFKSYLQNANQTTMQVLSPFLRAQVDFVHCSCTKEIFQGLHECLDGGKLRKGSISKDPTEELLIQTAQACRAYCENVVHVVKDSVPKVIGTVYIDDTVKSISNHLRDYIKRLSLKKPEALNIVDPHKEEKLSLSQRLKAIQKVEEYLLRDSSIKGVIWIEDLYIQTQKQYYDTERDITSEGSEEEKKQQVDPKTGELSYEVKVKKCSSEEASNMFNSVVEYREVAENTDPVLLKDPVQELRIKEIILTIGSSPEKQYNRPKLASMDSTASGSLEVTSANQIKGRARGYSMKSSTSIQSSNSTETSMGSENKNIVLGGLEVTQNYFLRKQALQEKVITRSEWLTALEQETLSGLSEDRILTSIRYGLPEEVRGSVWALIAGVKELKARHTKKLYEELSNTFSKWDYVIEKDVQRTLTEEPFFKDPEYEGGVKLSRVLRAYANYDPDLGYTQGMNTIAGMIIAVMCRYNHNDKVTRYKGLSKNYERNAFWVLVFIMKEIGYRNSFVDSYPRLSDNLRNFEKVLKVKNPEVLAHLKKWTVSVESAFMHQYMTLAGQYSSLELFVRIMDIFLVQGEAVVTELLLKAVETCKNDILRLKDDGLFKFLKHEVIHKLLSKNKRDINRLLI